MSKNIAEATLKAPTMENFPQDKINKTPKQNQHNQQMNQQQQGYQT